jgi:hypothetical protein
METSNANAKIVFIDNYWGDKIIPAILRDTTCILPERSEVWIPDGYENSGGGGYSTRKTKEIQEFTGTAEVRQDVMKKWEAEQLRCREETF